MEAAVASGRWKPYPSYKPSGIEWLGDVPEGWRMIRMRYLAEINPSKSVISSLGGNSEVSFVPMESVGEYGGLTETESRPISSVSSGYTSFINGDVLIAKITPCFENGKGALASGLRNGVGFGTTELHIVRPSKRIDGRFLFYTSVSDAFRKCGAAEMYGAGGQKRVPEQFILNFKQAPVPLPEQRAIAAFLEQETARIDTLIEKKERQIELLKEKRSALISHAVTKGLNPNAPMKDSGIEWLGEVPAHWAVAPVYSRYRVELGKMLDSKRITGENLLPYLRNVDVQWDRVNVNDLPEMDVSTSEYERYTLKTGDLLVCEGGEVGRTAMWNDELPMCAYQKAIHRLRPTTDDDHSRFFYYMMFSVESAGIFVAFGNPNTISHLTAEKLRVYRFAFPPSAEQIEICNYLDSKVSQIQRLSQAIQHSTHLLREYRTALISAAVTGKIDVRDEVPDA